MVFSWLRRLACIWRSHPSFCIVVVFHVLLLLPLQGMIVDAIDESSDVTMFIWTNYKTPGRFLYRDQGHHAIAIIVFLTLHVIGSALTYSVMIVKSLMNLSACMVNLRKCENLRCRIQTKKALASPQSLIGLVPNLNNSNV